MTSDSSRHRLGLLAVAALSLFGALFGLARADRAVSVAVAPSEAAMAALRAEMKEIAVAELRLAEAEKLALHRKRMAAFWRGLEGRDKYNFWLSGSAVIRGLADTVPPAFGPSARSSPSPEGAAE